MKKQVFGRKFSRDRGSRTALFRSLIEALVTHGEINTTYAKAKAISGEVDKLVTLAKKGSVAARRKVLSTLANNRKITDLLFAKVAPQFKDRKSGFTRIVNLPERLGDKAPMARLEWSQKIVLREAKPKKVEEKAKPTLKSRIADIKKATTKK